MLKRQNRKYSRQYSRKEKRVIARFWKELCEREGPEGVWDQICYEIGDPTDWKACQEILEIIEREYLVDPCKREEE